MHSIPQLIAAAGSSFVFSNETRSVRLHFLKDSGISSILRQLHSNKIHLQNRLTLHFENIKGEDVYPVLDVYINAENEEKPSSVHYAGSLALFGLKQSSGAAGKFRGRSHVLEVDEVVEKVSKLAGWSDQYFTLTFIPNGPMQEGSSITIGSIMLFYRKY